VKSLILFIYNGPTVSRGAEFGGGVVGNRGGGSDVGLREGTGKLIRLEF